jgi:type I restriction enzyme S subunit
MMARYAEYKESGVDLFELLLPAHWRLKKCRYIFRFNKGLTITKENLQETGIPCVNYGEIHSKYGFEVDPSKHALKCVDPSYLKHSEGSLLKKGDFVFADTSEDIEGSGNFTYLNSNEPAFAGYHTLIAKAEVEESIRFLAYVLDSASFRKQVRKTVKGVKVYSITQVILKNTVVWLPSLPEQTAIAKFLDDKVARIEALVGIKRRQIELLAERKQILIQNAVTQGLNPDAPMKESGVDWIGEIPAHWETKKIKYTAKIFRGKFTHRPRNDPSLYDGIYPFFQTGDVAKAGKFLTNYKQTLNEKGLRVSTLIPKGTVVITIAANIGDVSILDIDACFPDSVVGFNPSQRIKRDYLYFALSNMKQQFMNSSIKNTQMNLNVDRIGTNSICLPPLAEQLELIAFIEKQSQKINTAITLKQNQIEKLNEYKTTLINAAVTGKIKVVGE